MNLYFLVEGKTEFNIYPKWIKYLLPNFIRVSEYDQINHNNYFIFNGGGQPEIVDTHLSNAIRDINLLTSTIKYDYLFICLDSEELTIDELRDYILTSIQAQKDIDISNVKLVLNIQNRCIETWLLGNRNFILTQFSNLPIERIEPLLTYKNYYDVREKDPELMGLYDSSEFNTHAQFHKAYLKSVFKSRGISYSEGKPKEVSENFYLEQLIKRVRDNPEHLKSFQYFLSAINSLK